MAFKFERLEVWELAVEYVDTIYQIAQELPKSEEYNLKAQIQRAATSIALNIAEGSTGQTNTEQARFVGLAVRSLLETVACQHLINRREYLADKALLREAYREAGILAAKLQAFRKALVPEQTWLREDGSPYGSPYGTDFDSESLN
jgi:four helix bundle protein